MKEGMNISIDSSASKIDFGRMEYLLTKIPCFPKVALKAQQILNQPELNIDGLVTTLENDPTLVVKILKIANSPFYGLSRQIRSLRDACIVLGQHILRNIILTAAVIEIVQYQQMEETRYKDLWRHFIHTAIIARDLAKKVGVNGDTAYIVGLLHDIGSMFIEALLPDAALVIREKITSDKVLIEAIEKEVLGFNHAELSGAIARHWQFPQDIELSMSCHHQVNNELSSIDEVIYVADNISMIMIHHAEDSNVRNIIGESILDKFGFTYQSIEEYMLECISPDDVDLSELFG